MYEKFPDRPAQLTPGKTVGFDLVIVDNDGGSFSWQPWGSASVEKYGGPNRVGRFRLSEERAGGQGPWSQFLTSVATFGGQSLFLAALALGLVATGYTLKRVMGNRSSSEGDRLDHLERRMTDTQDVLIALSEKMDRIEEQLPRRHDGRDESGGE